MRRRDFIIAFGSVAAVSAPLVVRAQQAGKTYRIALVDPSTPVSEMNDANALYVVVLGELRRLGYVEGQNLIVKRYSGRGRQEHYHEVVSEVVRSNPDAVFAISTELTLEFKAQTRTIPVVAITATGRRTSSVTSLGN